jgi:hypothetical protein
MEVEDADGENSDYVPLRDDDRHDENLEYSDGMLVVVAVHVAVVSRNCGAWLWAGDPLLGKWLCENKKCQTHIDVAMRQA